MLRGGVEKKAQKAYFLRFSEDLNQSSSFRFSKPLAINMSIRFEEIQIFSISSKENEFDQQHRSPQHQDKDLLFTHNLSSAALEPRSGLA
jgi:hypothetical protein